MIGSQKRNKQLQELQDQFSSHLDTFNCETDETVKEEERKDSGEGQCQQNWLTFDDTKNEKRSEQRNKVEICVEQKNIVDEDVIWQLARDGESDESELEEVGKRYLEWMVKKIFVKLKLSKLEYQQWSVKKLVSMMVQMVDKITGQKIKKERIIIAIGKKSLQNKFQFLELLQKQFEKIIKQKNQTQSYLNTKTPHLQNQSFKNQSYSTINAASISNYQTISNESLFKKNNNIVIEDTIHQVSNQDINLSMQFAQNKENNHQNIQFIQNVNYHKSNKCFTQQNYQQYNHYLNPNIRLNPIRHPTFTTNPISYPFTNSYPILAYTQYPHQYPHLNKPFNQKWILNSEQNNWIGQSLEFEGVPLQNTIQTYLSTVMSGKSEINLFCQQMGIKYPEFIRSYDYKVYRIKAILSFTCRYLNNTNLTFQSEQTHHNLKTACNSASIKILRSLYTTVPQMWRDYIQKKQKKGLIT